MQYALSEQKKAYICMIEQSAEEYGGHHQT